MQEAAPPVDGRTLRALRTREAIVDATIAQIDEGDLRPTAPRVAERAGVSVRSIFQHFADLESLHAAVAERLAVRLTALVLPISPELPLPERVARFVRQRGTLLEAVTPIRRAANVHGPFSSEIQARLRDGQAFLRAEVATAFQPELDRVEAPTEALDALDTACGWAAWDGLRSGLGRSPEAAERVMARAIHALLA